MALRYMQYNGKCGSHYMRPVTPTQQNVEEFAATQQTLVQDDLPPAGKLSFASNQNKPGMRKDFDYGGVPVIFNNPYRQTLDESGKPLLTNIFSGAFEASDRPSILFNANGLPKCQELQLNALPEKKSGKKTNIIKPCNLDMTRNVPLIQSMLTGAWYGDEKDRLNNGGQSPTLMQQYKKSLTEYSKVVKTVKPMRQIVPNQVRRKRSDMTNVIVPALPKTESDVIMLYEGYPKLQTAAAMVKYLASCSAAEKSRYARSIRSSPVDMIIPMSQPHQVALQPRAPITAPRSHSVDFSACPPSNAPPQNDTAAEGDRVRARSSHREAIKQAKKLVRIRNANASNTVGYSIENQIRPASAMAPSGAITARQGTAFWIPRRKPDHISKDLQVSAFGATFAASGLNNLERILNN